jgi:esterase/lipase superfamily enzyme
MDETSAAAVADLRLFFSTAAKLYRSYVSRVDLGGAAETIERLAGERAQDADRLGEAALAEHTELPEPGVEAAVVRDELSFGRTPPDLPAQVLFRVQRAENQLGRLTDHLISVLDPGAVRAALEIAFESIGLRQRELREMRVDLAHSSPGYDRPAFAGGDAQMETLATKGEELVIWFATNRERNGRSWSRRSGNAVHYGRCRVFVPEDRPMGSLGPTLTKWGTKPIQLNGTEILTQEAFWTNLRTVCAELEVGARQALVFLHGYRTDFSRAARRAAQLKADLRHRGPAAFFAWPSADQLLGYANDKAAIEGSETAIREFLVGFAQRSGAERVHIIAHSMGNIGLLRAMDAIAHDAAARSGVSFGQIVLAAPDVDTRLFRNLAQAYTQLSARTTLYVAENDSALGGSRWLHGNYARAGLAPPVVVVAGVDTINVSRINLDLLGLRHAYAMGLAEVLGDIHALLRDGAPPDQRFRLRPAGLAAEPHWEFKP